MALNMENLDLQSFSKIIIYRKNSILTKGDLIIQV